METSGETMSSAIADLHLRLDQLIRADNINPSLRTVAREISQQIELGASMIAAELESTLREFREEIRKEIETRGKTQHEEETRHFEEMSRLGKETISRLEEETKLLEKTIRSLKLQTRLFLEEHERLEEKTKRMDEACKDTAMLSCAATAVTRLLSHIAAPASPGQASAPATSELDDLSTDWTASKGPSSASGSQTHMPSNPTSPDDVSSATATTETTQWKPAYPDVTSGAAVRRGVREETGRQR